MATTFTVTTLDDVVDANDGVLSLREALTAANSASTIDTIQFGSSLHGGQLTLSGGSLGITSSLTLEGAGVTLDGNRLGRVMDIAGSHTVVLENLTITGGRTPFDFYQDASGLRVQSGAQVKLRGSTVEGNGDGLANAAVLVTAGSSLAVDQSIVRGNSSYYGGAGLSVRSAALTVRDSLIADNSTASVNFAGGAGLNSYYSSTQVINSTFTGNSVTGDRVGGPDRSSYGGAIHAMAGNVTILHSTIVENSNSKHNFGGLFTYATNAATTVQNSLIAGNTALTAYVPTNIADANSSNTFASSNVLSSWSTGEFGSPATPGDEPDGVTLVDASTLFTDLLTELGDYGGPTPTFLPLAGGVLIDAGDNGASGAIATDARGADRRSGAAVDIGAVERQGGGVGLVVDTTEDTLLDDGKTSLREALALAGTLPGAQVITFDPSVFTPANSTIRLELGELVVRDGTTLTIDGDLGNDGSPDVTLDGQGASRVLNAFGTSERTDVTLDGLVITGGSITSLTTSVGFAARLGGGVSGDYLTVVNSLITGNVNTSEDNAFGGGVGAFRQLTIIGSTISDNTAIGRGAYGGGAYGAELLVSSSSLSGNAVASSAGRPDLASGGGAFAGGRIIFDDVTVSGNSSQGNGGGINVGGYSLLSGGPSSTIASSTISDNTAGLSGGGVNGFRAVNDPVLDRLIIADSVIASNDANNGGGIRFEGQLDIERSTVEDNTATNGGGGVYALGTATILDSTIDGNSAGALGGGVATRGTIEVARSSITDNEVLGSGTSGSRGGGGLFRVAAGSATITDSLIADNRTAGDAHPGGGLFLLAEATLTNTTVSNNSTTGGSNGGGIFHFAGSSSQGLDLVHVTLTANDAAGAGQGDGIFLGNNSSLMLTNSIVAGNGPTGSADDIMRSASGSLGTNGRNLVSQAGLVGLQPTDSVLAPADIAGRVLAPLADNGGQTLTHALLDGADNPAIAGGSPIDGLATDQRGAARIAPPGSDPDLGAFELDQDVALGQIFEPVPAGTWTSANIVALNAFMARSSDGKLDFTRIQGKLLFEDILAGGDGIDIVIGTPGADVLVLKSPHAPIEGGDREALRIVDIDVFDLGGGDDVLNLTSTEVVYLTNVLVFGGPGNDYLWSGAGDDTLHGGPGADYLIGGPGDDIYFGNNADGSGDGARDLYGISDIPNAGTDRVMDFELGVDKIRIIGFGKTSINQLDVAQQGSDTVVTVTDEHTAVLILTGIDVGQVVNSDFIFTA